MEITHYYVSHPIQDVCKQSAVWASGKETGHIPLVFLQRPKWIKDDKVWQTIVDSVQLRLPRNFDVK